MPELPEVEVVRRGIEKHLLGATFQGASVYRERSNRGQEAPLGPLLAGRRIEAVRRRGKYLWCDLGDALALFIHLGMSGQLLIGTPGSATSPQVRIRAQLLDAAGQLVELAFVDQRTFGRWLVTELIDAVPLPVVHIARDPLEADFDEVAVARRIRRKRSEIKRVLLDQTVVSGIGNIYADESLWLAGIRPTTPANSLLQRDTVALLRSAREVMTRALAAGGTSFDALYVNVEGAAGYFARELNVYGREGEPCPRCGTPIIRVSWTNRSTHYCPRCQLK